MFGIGPFEIVLICVVAVLLFGSRLPQIMRSVGQCLPAFKSGLKDYEEITKEIQNEITNTIQP